MTSRMTPEDVSALETLEATGTGRSPTGEPPKTYTQKILRIDFHAHDVLQYM